ncbi:ParB N-terminal domain-containing protein [Leptothoe sp. EHU-05/26/07-4]
MVNEPSFNGLAVCRTKELLISSIKLDFEIHPRARLDKTLIDEYAEAMTCGALFPSGVVFYDGDSYWLADGFHRLKARKLAGFKTFSVEIQPGKRRDAILFSSGLNSNHGLRRTNKDKRYVVSRMLQDPEWSLWSDNEIARRCHVTHPLVGKVRKELSLSCNDYKIETSNGKSVTANLGTMRKAQRGKVAYIVNTQKIGKSSKSESNFQESISTNNLVLTELVETHCPESDSHSQKSTLTNEIANSDSLTSDNDVGRSISSHDCSLEFDDGDFESFQILEVALSSKSRSVDEPELISFCPRVLCKDKGEALLLILSKMQQYPDFANRVYQEAQWLKERSNNCNNNSKIIGAPSCSP